MKNTLWLGLVFLTLEACTANQTAVFRSFDPDGTERRSVLVDAKQRAIIAVDRPYAGKKPRIEMDKKTFPGLVTKFCAEPSPDALSAISSTFATALNVGITGAGQGAGSLGTALNEAASEIGKRNATIQILRDGFYRLCEAQLNDATGDIHYNLHANKLLNSMIALLAIEQLTPSVKEDVKVTTGSNTSVNVTTSMGGANPTPPTQPSGGATGGASPTTPTQPGGGATGGASPTTPTQPGGSATGNASPTPPTQPNGGATGGTSDESGSATPQDALTAVNVQSTAASGAGAPSVATKISKGKDVPVSREAATSVAFVLAEYMRQSRFADCLLAMDNISLDLEAASDGAEPREPNLAQSAVIQGCFVVLKEPRPDLPLNIKELGENLKMMGEGLSGAPTKPVERAPLDSGGNQ